MDDVDTSVEQTLHIARSISVYRIPPRPGTNGWRSGEWLVSDKLFSGRLRVVAIGEMCEIRLENPHSGDLFAVCPVQCGQRSVCIEPVTDSSRYYVLRVEDSATCRHAFLGMGFDNRMDAFDFNEALVRHEQQVARERAVLARVGGAGPGPSSSSSRVGTSSPAATSCTSSPASTSSLGSAPGQYYRGSGSANANSSAAAEVEGLYRQTAGLRLQEGQTIRVNVSGLKKAGATSAVTARDFLSGLSSAQAPMRPGGPIPQVGKGAVILPPPPAPTSLNGHQASYFQPPEGGLGRVPQSQDVAHAKGGWTNSNALMSGHDVRNGVGISQAACDKTEGSPSEVSPSHPMSEAASAEAHPEDTFSEDEPETALEAMQHLLPEDRRKALRRLRNRESARRVRARRLAEVSKMGTTLQSIQDENAALKAHVNKLQSHIQSMTLKVYEVTAKYESAVADNARLRTELFRFRRPSAPGDSSYMAPAATGTATAATANGPSSAPLNQLSPFMGTVELAGGCASSHELSTGHVQLRSSSQMDLQRQRHALEEVVMMLKEHKRRNLGALQDRSGGSEIGSTGPGVIVHNNQSPNSDIGLPTAGFGAASVAPMGGVAASALGTTHSSNVVTYNVLGEMAGRFLGQDVPNDCGLNSSRLNQADSLHTTPQQQFQAQLQARVSVGNPGASLPALCNSFNLSNAQQSLSYLQQAQQQHLLLQAPQVTSQTLMDTCPPLSLCPTYSRDQPLHQLQQGPQPCGQSHSHSLAQLPPYIQHQFSSCGSQQQQQHLQAAASGTLYGTVSSLALSAPFYSAVSAVPIGGSAGSCGRSQATRGSLESGFCTGLSAGLRSGISAMAEAGLTGHHRSASYVLDCGTCTAASAQNAVALHPTWQSTAASDGIPGGGGLVMRPEDFTEDLLMSLDEYVPQDL